MFAKFNEMIENEDNSKTDLLENLKELARTISIYDQMKVAGELRENLDDIQGPLREEFYKVYAKYFVVRITEVRDNDDDFEAFSSELSSLNPQMPPLPPLMREAIRRIALRASQS